MKKDYLFPYRFKWIGWSLFLPFALLFFVVPAFFDFIDDDLISFPTLMIIISELGNFDGGNVQNGLIAGFQREGMFDEIRIVAMSLGLLFVAFAREKDEDEMTAHIRMQSFVWSLWFTSAILAFGILFIMGFDFLYFALVALYLYYLVYILKFNFTMRGIRRTGK